MYPHFYHTDTPTDIHTYIQTKFYCNPCMCVCAYESTATDYRRENLLLQKTTPKLLLLHGAELDHKVVGYGPAQDQAEVGTERSHQKGLHVIQQPQL